MTEEFRHPRWVAWLTPIGIVLFLGVGAWWITIAVQAAANGDYAIAGTAAIAGLLLLYWAYWGIRFLPYCRMILAVTDQGIEFLTPARPELSWADVAVVKDRRVLQLLELRDRRGKTVLIVDHYLHGYRRFREIVNSAVHGRSPNPKDP